MFQTLRFFLALQLIDPKKNYVTKAQMDFMNAPPIFISSQTK